MQKQDTGVADALRAGVLASLNVFVNEHKDEPSASLEHWQIRFVYTIDPQTGKRHTSQIEVTQEHHSAEMIAVGRAKKSLIEFIQQAISMSATLSKLPNARYAYIRMLYNNECPPGFKAPNFHEVDLATSSALPKEDWKRIEVANMNAGHHEACLSVGYSTRQHLRPASQPNDQNVVGKTSPNRPQRKAAKMYELSPPSNPD